MLLWSGFDGAIAGLVAVLLMSGFEVLFWKRYGMKGVVQWQVNEIMVSKLLRESYVEGRRLGWAVAMHLFHGVVLGTLFSILAGRNLPLIPGPLIVTFIALDYSLALWAIVPFSLTNSLERAAGITFTRRGMAVSLLAHAIYGVTLGWVLTILPC